MESLQQTLEGHKGSVQSVVFSHDSKLLASVSFDKTIKVWDTATGSLRKTLEGHKRSVRSVAFSHDSELLASGSDDKTIKIWDTAGWSLQQTLNVSTILYNISFDATSSYLLTEIGSIKLSIRSDSEEAPADALAGAKAETRVEAGSSTGQPRVESQPQSPSQAEAPRFCGCGLNPNKSWITWNGNNVLWLPPDYRPSASAILSSIPSSVSLSTGAIVALGCSSGRVLVFCIKVPVV